MPCGGASVPPGRRLHHARPPLARRASGVPRAEITEERRAPPPASPGRPARAAPASRPAAALSALPNPQSWGRRAPARLARAAPDRPRRGAFRPHQQNDPRKSGTTKRPNPVSRSARPGRSPPFAPARSSVREPTRPARLARAAPDRPGEGAFRVSSRRPSGERHHKAAKPGVPPRRLPAGRRPLRLAGPAVMESPRPRPPRPGDQPGRRPPPGPPPCAAGIRR